MKYVVYAFALLFFIIYLFSANYIFGVLIKTDKEATLANMSLPSDSHKLEFIIDEATTMKLKWKDVVFLRGWVFKQNVKENKRELYFVLKSNKSTLIFKIENDSIKRSDVSDYYNTNYFNMDIRSHNHGFEGYIPIYWLKDTSYNIGFIIEDETGKYYSGSSRELKLVKGNASIVDSEEGSEKKTMLDQVSIDIQKPTKEIAYHLDKVELSDSTLTIIGWGYLKGLDAKLLNSYVLLTKNENVHAFPIKVQMRTDVTKFYAATRLNLDSSGFQFNIPAENIVKGNYQLGLYINKGDQAGIVYDKLIKIW